MAWSGSGTFLRDYNWTADAAAAIPIRADRMDGEFANYKGGLENCLTRTGETPPLTNISWSNFKITNLGNASSSKDALNVLTAQNSGYIWGGTTTGAANTYAATLTPPITSYSTGMVVRVLTHQANTGAATLNLNGVGAIGILTARGSALSTGDIPIGLAEFLYDGTNWRVIGVLSSTTTNEVQSGSLFWGGTSTGAANTYAITPSPALVAYAAGNRFWFITHQANTGAATLNVNGLGVKSILDRDGNALIAGQIFNGMLLDVVYDGTNFRIIDGMKWTNIAPQTQGDIPYFGTSGAASILSAGSVGQGLMTLGSGANPSYREFKNIEYIPSTTNWVVPPGITRVLVTLCGGGGGGGAGSGAGSATGGTGGTTSFGTLLSSTGGTGGQTSGVAGSTGTQSGAAIIYMYETAAAGSSTLGGKGGWTIFGSGGNGATPGQPGRGFGAGGGGGNTGAGSGGGGGGSSLPVQKLITGLTPGGSITITIGTGGAGGFTIAGLAGGNGIQGICILEY